MSRIQKLRLRHGDCATSRRFSTSYARTHDTSPGAQHVDILSARDPRMCADPPLYLQFHQTDILLSATTLTCVSRFLARSIRHVRADVAPLGFASAALSLHVQFQPSPVWSRFCPSRVWVLGRSEGEGDATGVLKG